MFRFFVLALFLFTFLRELAVIVIIALLVGSGVFGCTFEDEIAQASDECETKVREVFEEFEEKLGYLCLTEEELLEYLDDQLGDHGDSREPIAIRVNPAYSHALYKQYGIYDSNLKMCLSSRDFYRMERFPL